MVSFVNLSDSDQLMAACAKHWTGENATGLILSSEYTRFPDNKLSVERYGTVPDCDELLSMIEGGAKFSYYGKDIREHSSQQSALADCLASKLASSPRFWGADSLKKPLYDVFLKILTTDHEISMAIRDDLIAHNQCNPGCNNDYLKRFKSQRFLACPVYRVAHKLWLQGDERKAHEIQDLAYRSFDVKIHPGAKLGRGIAIDPRAHKLVIGETAVIGDNAIIVDENTYVYRENLLDGKSYHVISSWASRLAVELPGGRFDKMDIEFLYKIILKTLIEDQEIWRDVMRDDDLRTASQSYYFGYGLNFNQFLAYLAYTVAHKLCLLGDESMASKIKYMASRAFGVGPGKYDDAIRVVIGKTPVIEDNGGKILYFLEGNWHDEESYYRMSSKKNHSYEIVLKKSFAGGSHQKYVNTPDDGATAVGMGHGGGESSGDGDGGGDFHAIQLHQADQDPARSTELIALGLNNTSFASDQSNEQPPPGRFPSDIEMVTEIVEEEPEFDLSGMAKTMLLVSAEQGLAIVAAKFGAGESIPKNTKILLFLAEVCSVAGFLFCSGGYILQRSRSAKSAARLMTAAGAVAAISGFILMMATLIN
ncbi:Serine acetyltransferase [Melia azedarach]|uniref:Serine acetyltransferase n=1 Tax=Melia azedarach TaxID=155640 RepID=A0ACC1YJG0_MELAZ|nr:Serine acetyltransferase [Melia azedarach]